MSKITKIAEKLPNGSFSEPIPIGAKAINVTLNNGLDLETELLDIRRNKADRDHSSTLTDYGIGTPEKYGHLKLVDNYKEPLEDSDGVAISQKAVAEIFKKYLNVFTLLDNDSTLFSKDITAYYREEEPTTLFLVSNYFRVEEDSLIIE